MGSAALSKAFDPVLEYTRLECIHKGRTTLELKQELECCMKPGETETRPFVSKSRRCSLLANHASRCGCEYGPMARAS
jgi:hypothetical protein